MKTPSTHVMIAAILCATQPLLQAKDGQIREHRQLQLQERQAHRAQQHQENQQARNENKGLKGEAKLDAIKEHRTQQHGENDTFIQKQHEENMVFFKERLAKNTKLTEEQKTELTTFFEEQYQEKVSFRDQRFSEIMAYFDKTAGDTSLTMAQKKTAIRDYIKDWKAKSQAFHAEQKTERQTFRNELKAGAGAGADATP